MEYFDNIETGISLLNNQIALASTGDEYDSFDYSGYIFNLNEILRQLIWYKSAYKYMRMDKEEFLSYQDKQVIITHTVKDFETPLSISKKYNKDLSEILILNNATIEDIVAGKELKILLTNKSLYEIYQNIPTFGSQKDLLVLGNDLPNVLTEDEDGDFLVLDPVTTLEQGVNNRLKTKKGSYPLDDTFGTDVTNRLGFPDDIANALITVNISEQLEGESRLSSIESVKVGNDREKRTIEIQARTITNNMLRVNK